MLFEAKWDKLLETRKMWKDMKDDIEFRVINLTHCGRGPFC